MQVVFNDKTEIRLVADQVLYVSNRGGRRECKLADMDQHKGTQFHKRYAYAVVQAKDAFGVAFVASKTSDPVGISPPEVSNSI